MGSSSSAPPPPDYAALIPTQTAANKDQFNYALNASRVNTNGPQGQQTWSQGPDGRWTQNTTLNPEQQQTYDNQQHLSNQFSGTASSLLTGVQNRYGTAANFADQVPQQQAQHIGQYNGPTGLGQLPEYQKQGYSGPQYEAPQSYQDPGQFQDPGAYQGPAAYNGPSGVQHTDYSGPNYDQNTRNEVTKGIYDQSAQFLDPQFARAEHDQRNDLVAQGFSTDSDAYRRASGQLAEQKQNAYQGARNSAIAGGEAAAAQEAQTGLNVAGQRFGSNLASNGQDFQSGLAGASTRYNAGLAGAGQAFNANLGREQARFGANLQAAGQRFNTGLMGAGQAFNARLAGSGQDFNSRLAAEGGNYNAGLAGQQARFNAGLSGAGQAFQAGVQGGQFGLQQNQQQLEFAQQQIAQQAADRARQLNELNAFRTGGQVAMPTGSMTQNAPQGLQGTDLLGASKATFDGQLAQANAQDASRANTMNGLMGLAGNAAMFFSDIRLKKDIKHVGKTPGGNKVYDFKYKGSENPMRGVMAQDLLKTQPSAVSKMPNGFYAVDYAKVK